MADPTLGPAVARSSTTLPCPAVPSGFLTGLYIPSFSQNLVGVGYLQDRGITVTFPAHGRTAICMVAYRGTSSHVHQGAPLRLLRLVRLLCLVPDSLSPTRPSCGTTVLATCQSPASAAWLVTVLNRVSLASLRRSLPRQHRRALLASPAACAPLRTPPPFVRPLLPSRLSTETYTTVFPLAKKSEVTSTVIWWLLATEGTRGRRVSCLHSDRGGEFFYGILRGFCSKKGISQSWTLPESPQQNGVAERRIGLVMDIALTSMIHARTPHFLWPYPARYAAHELNLKLRVSPPEASPTSLWTGSPARAIPCVFLGFPVDSPDHAFYHPPLHQFLDSRDVRFDESVSYYTRYPYRGLSVPPPPLFLAPSPPPAPTPPIPPPPPGPVPSTGGAATGGTRSGGALLRGAGAGGVGTGGASSGGAGAGGVGAGGASSEGAGGGGAGTGGASSGGAGAGVTGIGGASSENTGAGGTTTAPPHRHDTRLQAAWRHEREEQERLEQESGLWALGFPSAPPVHSLSPTVYGPTFPPRDSASTVFSPPQSQSFPPILLHDWTTFCPTRARPSSPFDDLYAVLFHSSPRRDPPVSVLPPPPTSSLIVSSHPITDYYHAARPVVSRVLVSLVTDPCASPSSVSALTAAVADFASTRRLEFATHVVAALPARPLSAGGEFSLGCCYSQNRLEWA
ncbi:unnamed protein product [Closterium sp. NIES-53]